MPITVFGQGSRQQDYVSTDDIAFAVGQTLTSGASGIINVASGKPISNLNVARLISKPYGVPILREGEDPDEGVEWNVSIEKASSLLDYRPTKSSEESITALITSSLLLNN